MNNMLDESFLRPPLWEDITSSIQNIDPENAIMLGTTATHVKLESCETDQFIEPLSTSPLLSPLEIKHELKQQHLHTQMHAVQPLQVHHTQHVHNHQPMQISHPIHLTSNGKWWIDTIVVVLFDCYRRFVVFNDFASFIRYLLVFFSGSNNPIHMGPCDDNNSGKFWRVNRDE